VFAKVGTEKECDSRVIDFIPLSEVEGVCCAETGNDTTWHDGACGHKKPEHERRSQSFRTSSSIKSSDSIKTKLCHSFLIRTSVDGYNSGRTYHLQASSAAQCAALADKLAAASAAAKKAKEAKTRFEKSQARRCHACQRTDHTRLPPYTDHAVLARSQTLPTVLALLKKAGNLRRGKVENRQAFVLEQPRLSLPNR
jgi:hypothetical protein